MASGTRIAELAERLGRIAHGLQFAAGLNPAQWQALRFIGRANGFSCTPGALADFLGTTKGTASQTLIALENKGLLERRRCPEDRRSVRIALTQRGEALLQADPLSEIAAACEALPESLREGLADGMARVIRELQAVRDLPSFGPCVECTYLRGKPDEEQCRCGLSGDSLDCATLRKLCADFLPAG